MRRDSGRCVLIPDYNVYDYTITEDGEYSYVMGNINDCEFRDEYSLQRRISLRYQYRFSDRRIYRIATNF